jgi:hypothetical protein
VDCDIVVIVLFDNNKTRVNGNNKELENGTYMISKYEIKKWYK